MTAIALPRFDLSRVAALMAAALLALASLVSLSMTAPALADDTLSESDVRAIVTEMLDDERAKWEADQVRQDFTELDPDVLHPMIESYLMENPKLLQRMSVALETQLRQEEAERSRVALASYETEVFNNPGDVVIGNPDGDVTLVEFFDYNCPYCAESVPDLMQLIDSDPNLRIVLKEFPILSQESLEAARIAFLVADTDVDYFDFHARLFSTPGKIGREAALNAAADLGLSRVDLELRMESPEVNQALQDNYALAQGLGLSTTPTFILGDEIIRGALGYELLKQKIDNVRACGSTACEG
ncbi:DsbA family protein [Cucumibacter marinus]|uniref:DsbA family protein n=1 Tax=Cucumibacter marinus TaxID=1121252 RepID=UPI0004072392|nr:DsbA family protein [Cucumibacter marinus]